MYQVRILKQIKLAIVRAGSEDVGELAIIVVPGELERPAAEVLLIRVVWPGVCCPVVCLIVARGVVCTIAADFLHPVEGLRPERTVCRISFARLLAPVRKYSSQLALACLFNCQVVDGGV